MSVDDQSLFNPPVLSGAEPEMAPTHADEEELPGAVPDDGTDGHKGEEVPTTEVTADANAANTDHTPTPDVPDHNAMHDPLTMRDPSEILDDGNFDPTSVGEIVATTNDINSAAWSAAEMADKATLVKTFVVLEGHRVHVESLEWDVQLRRGQSRTLQEDVLRTMRKSAQDFGLFAMVQVMVHENGGVSNGV